jgi:hypothetical protein
MNIQSYMNILRTKPLNLTSTGQGTGSGATTSIMDSDVNANAGIRYSKLALGDSIKDSDISTDANIALNKLANFSGQDLETYLTSLSGGGSVLEASTTQTGTVNTADQSFAGKKTFNGGILIQGDASYNFGITLTSQSKYDISINALSYNKPQIMHITHAEGNHQRYILQIPTEATFGSSFLVFKMKLKHNKTLHINFYAEVTMIGTGEINFTHSLGQAPAYTNSPSTSNTCKYLISCTGPTVTGTLIGGQMNGVPPEITSRFQSTNVIGETNFYTAFGRRPTKMYIVDLYTYVAPNETLQPTSLHMIIENTPIGTLDTKLASLTPNYII